MSDESSSDSVDLVYGEDVYVVLELKSSGPRVDCVQDSLKRAVKHIMLVVKERYYGLYSDNESEEWERVLEVIKNELDSYWGSDCDQVKGNAYRSEAWTGYEIQQSYLAAK